MAPDVMGKLRDLLDREVDRYDREWMQTVQRLTVTERTEKRQVTIRSRDLERDCLSIVNQLVTSMPKDVLLRTSFTELWKSTQVQAIEEVRVRSKFSFTRKVQFTDAREEYEPSLNCSSGDETMSGESGTFEFIQDDLPGETMLGQPKDKMLSGEPDSWRPREKVLSRESRNITDRSEHNDVESIGSSDVPPYHSESQSWENTWETTSNFSCFGDCNSFLVGGMETTRAGPGNSSGPGQRQVYL